MHILCHNTGFHTYTFNMAELKVEVKQGCIETEKGLKFRVNDEKNLVFLIGIRSRSNNYYVSEIVYNNGQYIVNRKYQQSYEYYDVQFGDNFSLIVGRDIHQVLFHQTSREIIPNEESVTGFMVKKDVKYLKLFKLNQKDIMLVVTNNFIRLFELEQIYGKVECYGDDQFQTGEYTYESTVYTRNCYKKIHNGDTSPLSACKMTHFINVYLNEGFTFEDKKFILLILSLVVVGLILIFGFLFKLYSRYKNRMVSDL